MNLLSGINQPADLKDLSLEELEQLAEEVRDEILAVVSLNGGHLASSLGVVELTLALHYTFDSPRDRIVWDVGHQTYAHKLLTGRRDRFGTLRQQGGLAGFPRTDESEHDRFNTGHSSTSISAAVGIAEAMRLRGEPGRAVAVIGDGSLTAGLALEGLNQAGGQATNLIVVLNDNEMSISENVGAISSWLSRKLTGSLVTSLRKETKAWLRSFPHVGEPAVRAVHRALESSKALLTPGVLFEGLGFEYLGPINGHRIDRMLEAFTNARNLERPVLVHVRTRKGKGYPPAEKNPSLFHGVGPFDVQTGEPRRKSGPPSYTRVFGETLVELASEDQRVIGITAAMPGGTGLELFAARYPERFHDVGIAEQHGLVFAAGLAAEGFRPVAAIYSTFMQRAYDQIVHDVCMQDLPVVLSMDRGGLVGEDGPTHHGVFDLGYLRSLPNLVLAVPRDEDQLRHLLATALDTEHPFALRYPRGRGEGVALRGEPAVLPVGTGEELFRHGAGKDVALIGVGPVVHRAREAAEALAADGVEATVIDARFVKPLDEELLLDAVAGADLVISLEENAVQGGFGSALLELLAARNAVPRVFRMVGVPDRFLAHGPPQQLREECGLHAEGIIATVRRGIARVRLRDAGA